MAQSAHRSTVYVSRAPLEALSSPTFIVREGGRYYVTLALWEYDPAQATTPDEREGCRIIAEGFERGAPVEARLSSAAILSGGGGSHTHVQLPSGEPEDD